MGYLICDNCGGYYELQQGELPGDFSNKCECGGNLRYAETISTTKARGRKSVIYMCVDIKCKFDKQEYTEGHCPECGKQLHEVNSKEALRIADHKKKYSNNPKFFKEVVRRQNIENANKPDPIKLVLWLVKVVILLTAIFLSVIFLIIFIPFGLIMSLGTYGMYKILFDK